MAVRSSGSGDIPGNPHDTLWHARSGVYMDFDTLWHALTRPPLSDFFGINWGHIIFESVKECHRVSFGDCRCKIECQRVSFSVIWGGFMHDVYPLFSHTHHTTKRNEQKHSSSFKNIFHKQTGLSLWIKDTLLKSHSYPHTLCQRWEVALSPFGRRFTVTTAARHDAWMRAGVEQDNPEVDTSVSKHPGWRDSPMFERVSYHIQRGSAGFLPPTKG